MTTFTSPLYHIATNPNHSSLLESVWNRPNQRVYHLEGNTLYQRITVYDRQRRNWLISKGLELGDDFDLYQPVIRVENGIVTTWETQVANISNRILGLGKVQREISYPNLYFVQIGNHPYPKYARYRECWNVTKAQLESHRIIYPHHDPKQHYLETSQIPLLDT